MKILIIEDERLLADSLRALLTQKRFEAECVYDGESGAEYAVLGVYDLLILDVMMPGMDGYEVARTVRAKRCGTPILMLTARSGLEDRIQGLDTGADYYLTKPFDSRELLACVNALLRRLLPQGAGAGLCRHFQRAVHAEASGAELCADWRAVPCGFLWAQSAAGPLGRQAGGEGLGAAASVCGGCFPRA